MGKFNGSFGPDDTEIEDELKELASLARLVTFAKQRAHALQAEFPAYCLDLALGALLQEMYADDDMTGLHGEEPEPVRLAMPH